MKILIPTAKTLRNIETYFEKDKISKKTELILKTLLKYDIDELETIYKIKKDQAIKEYKNLRDIKSNKKNANEAINLFDGLMYKNIKRVNLTKQEIAYYKNNVFITSSFYGIINSFSKISPHRLDFQQKIKIEEQTLKKYWQEDFDNFVKDEDIIISLLSSEFEEVFSKKVRKKFIKISFLEEKNGEYKSHSTISKKARGKFLTNLVENNVKSLEDIKKIKFDNYIFYKELKQENKLIFLGRK